MQFAIVNDNMVKEVTEFADEESANSVAHLNQAVILIDGMDPAPTVGWLWVNGLLKKDLPPISPRQIRLALVLMGVSLTDIDAALDSLPEPTKSLARISWEYSMQYYRDDELVNSVATLLGWTSAQADYLWEFGGSL